MTIAGQAYTVTPSGAKAPSRATLRRQRIWPVGLRSGDATLHSGIPVLCQNSSTLSRSLSSVNTPLWDATGSYTNVIVENGSTDHFVMNLTQSAVGGITGNRSDIVTGATYADINTSLTGKIGVKSGVTGASLKISGTVSSSGYTGPAKGKASATLDLVAKTLTIAGSMKLCVSTPIGKKCETVPTDGVVDLPSGVSGDWTLDTDLAAIGDELSGTGLITLSNGRTLTYEVSGKYDEKTGDAKLKLTGQGEAERTSLSIVTHGTEMDLTELKGKVLGQKPLFP